MTDDDAPRLTFTIPGRPQPWQRVKVMPFRKKGSQRLGIRAFVPATTANYKDHARACALAAVAALGWTWHLRDTFGIVLFVYRDDDHDFGGKNQGDWDNFGKGPCDSFNGLLYHDDKAIVDGRVVKRLDPFNPRVEVELWRISDGRLWRAPKKKRAKAA